MKIRWCVVLLLMVSSAVSAQYQTDPTNRFPIGPGSRAPKSKKPPKNPVTSTKDKEAIPLKKAEKFYPLNGKPKSTATPMNKLPKPGTVWKKDKTSKRSSLYADPSK